MKPILVTTQHRGVFFGWIAEGQDITARSLPLVKARCAIYWATKSGVSELAKIGPNKNSRIGSEADIAILHDITAVWDCTEEAAKLWAAHS